jgi:addiction module RelB/DinJ family antitoxin
MSLVTRTAILQARVSPEIKYASEKVLKGLGLNLTEVIEMFLRRMVLDQRIPFDVVALSDTQLAQIAAEYEHQLKIMKTSERTRTTGRRRRERSKSKRE